MSDWIDLSALWRIVVLALLLGAGLPALFGIGLRLLSPSNSRPHAVGSSPRAVPANPAAVAAAALCFAVVLAAIGWGIYLIVAGT
jgi:hypothetical protein